MARCAGAEEIAMSDVRRALVDLSAISTNRRRLITRTALAGAAAFTAPAILTSKTRAQSQVEGKITLAYLGTADQQEAWKALFKMFSETYPNIQLEATGNPVNNWAGFFDAISTQIAGGQIPDIIQVATEGQRLFASRGLVEPIDDLLARDEAELADFFADIHPNLIEWNKTYSSPDGQTYYLPGEFNTMCMWYNAEVLAAAGAAEPTDDWTWDDFMAIGQKVVDAGNFAYAASPGYFAGVMPWLLTNGASSLSDDWKTATINTPAAIEAATFLRDLVANKFSPELGGTFDPVAASADGKLAMFGGGRWPVINVRKLNFIDKCKIAPWPKKVQQGSPVGWNAYPIMKGTKNKEAAWAFVKFITSKQASEYFATQGGTIVPPRKSVAESDAFLSNAPAGSEKLYAALEYSIPIPSPDKGNLVQTDIEEAFTEIMSGDSDPTEALNDLNEKVQDNL
jgi:multiple sugar transport system substrate-binding protein